MIDVAGIQRMLANLDPIGVANEAERLRKAATGVRETGEDINGTWTHSLNPGVYEAPEGEQLRQAARPVQDNTAEFAWGVWQVAGALEAYAEEIRPIKTRLEALLVDAHAFVLNADDDWREDEDQVAENNRLVGAVRDQAIALANAEEACAAKIYAAYGGRAPGPMCVDGPASPPPWGTAEEADLPWYDDALNAVQSFGGGLWEVTWGGFSTLFGLRGGEAAGEAWESLGKWALSSAIVSIPGAQSLLVFDPVRDMVWNSNKEMVKGFAAWDEWDDDPARAAGMVFGNVLMLAGAKKVPTAARGAGKAARAANRGLRAATAAGRALDPMTQLSYAGTKAINIAKAMKRTGVELIDPSNYRIGPQPAMAGAPADAAHNTPGDHSLAAKTREAASGISERVKSLLTLAEASGNPTHSLSPSGETPNSGGGNGPEGGTPDPTEQPTLYRDEDGKLHLEGDAPNTYRTENGRLHHILDPDPEATYRLESDFSLRKNNGDFVNDPLTGRAADFLMEMTEKKPYRPSPTAQADLHQVAKERAIIEKRRITLGGQLDLIKAKYGIKELDDLNSVQKVEAWMDAEDMKIHNDDSLSVAEKKARSDDVQDVGDLFSAYNEARGDLNIASEKLGMIAAKDFLVHKLGGEPLTPLHDGPGRSGTFDVAGMDFKEDLFTLLSVEAKGVGGSLGTRKVDGGFIAQQGSPPYGSFIAKIDADLKQVFTDNPELAKKVGQMLQENKVRLKYYYVHVNKHGKVSWAEFILGYGDEGLKLQQIAGVEQPGTMPS